MRETDVAVQTANAAWIDRWLDGVVSGASIMSQRSRLSIDGHGGLVAVVSAARRKRVHLVELTDDHGRLLVAASREPFTALC